MDEMAFYEDMLKRKRMLPQALGMQSPGGVLTQDVQPGQAASALPRSLELRRKIAELEGAQGKDDGGMSTLNALAAQFAGESFQPIQAQYLKRAAAASPQARTQAQLARLEREAEIADRYEGQQSLQAERLTSQREMEAERRAAAEERRAAEAQLRRELKSMGGGAQPYYQPLQTGQGVMAFNSRTGRMEPVMGADGKPIIGAATDPGLQGRIAGAKASASAEGKMTAEAAFDAPKAIAQGQESIRLVDDLLKAPGFKQAVGASRLAGFQLVPGTNAKDFDIRLDQLKGQQFLQAYETLKGGGQITEVEGKKATDAIARMNASGSEAEFTKAAREFQSVIDTGVKRSMQRIQVAPSSGAPPGIDARVWNAMTPEEKSLWK